MARKQATPTTDRSKTSAPATYNTPQNIGGTSAVLQRLEQAPRTLRPADILHLQRSIGNRATGQLLQAKLKLGPAGDQYEQEADRVAKQVVQSSRQPAVQREEGEESPLPASPYASSISSLQRSSTPASSGFFVARPPKPKVQREESEESPLPASPYASSMADYVRSDKPVAAGISRVQRGFGARPPMPKVQREEVDDEMMQAKPVAESNPKGQGFFVARPLPPKVQRDETEDELQAKPLAGSSPKGQGFFVARPLPPKVQREEMEEELQAAPNHGMEGGDVDAGVERSIQNAKGGGQPLHDGVRSSMEKGFGADFSGVNVHTDSESDALNRSLNAKAFTTGSDIFFSKGQYNPGSTSGQELIAHELTHTVQQGAAHLSTAQRSEETGTGVSGALSQSAAVTIQRTMREVTDTTESRLGSALKNGGIVDTFKGKLSAKTYVRGNQVDVDESEMIQDPEGNSLWYKIVGTTDEYIRATKLAIGTINIKNLTDADIAKLDQAALKQIGDLFNYRDFKVPVHGHPVEMPMKEVEGRDAQYQKGFLTTAEEQAIKTLSSTEIGRSYLADHGFLNEDEVQKWATNDRIAGLWERYEEHGVHKLDPFVPVDIPSVQGKSILSNIHRLQIATRQKDLGIADKAHRNRPGYLRYEAYLADKGTDEEKSRVKEEIYARETQTWADTLKSETKDATGQYKKYGKKEYGKQTESAMNILRRVFILLHDGMVYRDEAKGIVETEWNERVAVALSHGGRVMIKLPPLADDKQDQNAFINWLLGNNSNEKVTSKTGADTGTTVRPQDTNNKKTEYHQAGVDTRIASSHSILIGDNEFTERKGHAITKAPTARAEPTKGVMLFGNATHYGMDLPLGGLGTVDIAGDTTLPDGRHGHLYIYFDPPTMKLPGGVLIGLETSRMGHTDTFGQYHDLRGAPAEFSSAGTAKSVRIGQEIDGRTIDYSKREPKTTTDLTGTGAAAAMASGAAGPIEDPSWLQQLKKAERNVNEGLKSGMLKAEELVGKVNREHIFATDEERRAKTQVRGRSAANTGKPEARIAPRQRAVKVDERPGAQRPTTTTTTTTTQEQENV